MVVRESAGRESVVVVLLSLGVEGKQQSREQTKMPAQRFRDGVDSLEGSSASNARAEQLEHARRY